MDDTPQRDAPLRELHLFAGIGGGVLGGLMLGHRPVGFVEANKHCQGILARRFPGVPIHGDIKTYEGTSGSADVVCGGFPCQDISAAGKGAGLQGSRSGLWFEMLRVVSEVEPRYVFVENSPMLRTRGLGVVLRGLADLGFDAEWGVLSAAAVGAPHIRKRMWVLAARRTEVADAYGKGLQVGQGVAEDDGPQLSAALGSRWWTTEPSVGRVVDGFPGRGDQIRALGNAQVPLQAATAFSQLWARLHGYPSSTV